MSKFVAFLEADGMAIKYALAAAIVLAGPGKRLRSGCRRLRQDSHSLLLTVGRPNPVLLRYMSPFMAGSVEQVGQ